MESYILKNSVDEEKVLLYQEKTCYSFSPKKGYKVKKVTVFNEDMIECLLKDKIINRYKRLIKIIYSIINSDDTTDGDILVTYTEIDRLKSFIINDCLKHCKKEFVEKYLKKLEDLELELKKLQIKSYNFMAEPVVYEEKEERGKSR